MERIATLEAQSRQLEETIEGLRAEVAELKESNRQLQRLQDMFTGMSWSFRLVLKLFGGMLGVGVLHWIVQSIHWIGNWLNAPMRTGH